MKIKYLIIASLMLVILTIGAVSATDDVDKLVAGDEGAVLEEASDDVIESENVTVLEEASNEVIESDDGAVLEDDSGGLIGPGETIDVNIVRSEINYDSNEPVIFILGNSNATGKLILSAGENTVFYNKDIVLEELPDNEGIFSFGLTAADLPDLPLGTYLMNATFITKGGNTFNNIASVAVNWDFYLYLNESGEWYKLVYPDFLFVYCNGAEDRQIKVVVPKSLQDPVKYSFGGQYQILDIKDGEGFITIPSTTMEIKYYTLAVQAGEKEKSFSVHVESDIRVLPIVEANKEFHLNVILPQVYSGNASVYLYNDSTHGLGELIGQGAIVNGRAALLIQGLPEGNYEYWVIFEFSNYTLDNEAFLIRAVENSPNVTVSVTPNEITVGSPITVSGTGPWGNFDIYIDGAYRETFSGGYSFTRVISDLDVGQHRIAVIYLSHDANYTYSGEFNVIVKNKAQIIANAITATYNVNKNLVITLKDQNGKALSGIKVTVNLNGAKTYTTDKNGQIKISTKGLAPKVYTAKITFNGDAKYYKSAKNVKVTVKKAKPKLTAKNKKFKKSLKVKKYTVVLKSNVGKAIKKVKVTLKIKGKKVITVKTSSKGKATFKIKKMTKKGKFKATVTFKGDKYYNKVTKKVKITIK